MEKIDERWGRQFIVINTAVFGDSHLPNIFLFPFWANLGWVCSEALVGFFLRFFGFYIYVFSFFPSIITTRNMAWRCFAVLYLLCVWGVSFPRSRLVFWGYGYPVFSFNSPFLTYYLYWL